MTGYPFDDDDRRSPAERRRDQESLLGAFFGLVLKCRGYARDETAAAVVERYPTTERQLRQLLKGGEDEREDEKAS
jgi:hypothetical protein